MALPRSLRHLPLALQLFVSINVAPVGVGASDADRGRGAWNGRTMVATSAPVELGAGAAGEQPLQLLPEVEGFSLAGGDLSNVNGGRFCVGPWGKEPPGFELYGIISLDECAAMAARQPKSVGFRWGAEHFDAEAYREYMVAASEANTSSVVDLSRLFDGSRNFTCVVHVSERVPWSVTAVGTIGAPQFRRGSGEEVCYQRWTLIRFFYPAVTEMWFCYVPSSEQERCEVELQRAHHQGYAFLSSFAVFIGVLSYVMRGLSEFETPLLWIARVFLCLELSIGATALLVKTDLVREGVIAVVTVSLVYVLQYAMLAPYRCVERFAPGSAFGAFYLLVIVFSPCAFLEYMSYRPAFPLIVAQWPIALGAGAFGLDLATHAIKNLICPRSDKYEALEEEELYRGPYATARDLEPRLPTRSRW
eukprot:TRINITY_DN14512_c0_g1_i1.p1 TRINITY_DN14512_c0_g1~~TRINITY_DN14512_c0_g1_i1.p1  ORF type:complete len:419 (-),score=92.88 TRINITY_DN14512_c0_g1_i1:18-1274(-)